MPYEVKKVGSQFCVFKKGTSKKFGCHKTKKDAIKQMRALYVNTEGVSASAIIRQDSVSASIEEVDTTEYSGDDKIIFELEEIDGTPFVNIYDVPIVQTGIEYMLSTGPFTATTESLADAVAAQEDPAIRQPRLALGHSDPRFSGDPALGRVEDMYLSENGQTIYGNLIAVPRWLGDIMPIAYPNRSFEGVINAKTVTGKEYRLVIEDLALLGRTWPGISTLDDLPILFTAEGPESEEKVAAIGGNNVSIRAQMNVEDVRRAFYKQFVASDSQYHWWWIRQMLMGPDELIADDGEGCIYKVPFTVSGDDVEFGDPTEVKVRYEEVPTEAGARLAAAAIAATRGDGQVLATYASRKESNPEGGSMDPKQIRSMLGLAEDATDKEVQAQLAELNKAVNAEAGDGDDAGGDDAGEEKKEEENGDAEGGEAGEGEAEAKKKKEPVAAGTVTLDKAAYEELVSGAKDGREAYKRQQAEDKERHLSEAIKAGKFPPARKNHWSSLWDKDPEGTREAIANLEPGLIPVNEAGVSADGDTVSKDAYPEDWFPEVQARRERLAAGRPRVMGEAI